MEKQFSGMIKDLTQRSTFVETVTSAELRPGNLIIVSGGNEKQIVMGYYVRAAEEARGQLKTSGTLLLDDTTIALMGVSPILHDARLIKPLDEEPGPFEIRAHNTFQVAVPRIHLGVALDEIEKNKLFNFIFQLPNVLPMYVVSGGLPANLINLMKQPLEIRKDLMNAYLKTVSNWPGKNRADNPITEENIRNHLFIATRGTVSPRQVYWINPDSAQASKYGLPISDPENIDTVWDLANLYLTDFYQSGKTFSLERAAALWYWGKKLGLAHPRELTEQLRVQGLWE